jgi:hypothetical protein
MSVVLIDDQQLSAVLRGSPPRITARKQIFTTGYWYVRLCQAVLGRTGTSGTLSRPFTHLPASAREQAAAALLELPREIGLLSLRDLGPRMGQLRARHTLNVLGMEALAAAVQLEATVILSAPSPKLEAALEVEGVTVRMS